MQRENMLWFVCFGLILIVALTGQAVAQNGRNGTGSGADRGGISILGPVDPLINGDWGEFSFGLTGSFAQGCQPADPAGEICVPSSGGNSIFLDAPPWTFAAPFGGVDLTVTDAFLYGDVFEVFDFGGSLGTTAVVPTDGSCGDDPDVCFPDPASSSGVFPLAAGAHSLTVQAIVSPFNSGAAYFRLDTVGFGVDIDVKFCSNPNAFNCKAKGNGKTPLTIFGTADFDVTQVDLATVQLCTDIFGNDCTPAGAASWSLMDRGDPSTDLGADMCALEIDPVTGELVEVDYLNPDGWDDLDLTFYSRDVAALIGCPLAKGTISDTLVLVGYLLDGTPFFSVPVGDVGIDQLLVQR